MPVGWHRLVDAVRERGQSEVLGATLLTGIMVILVAMAGLFLFADFGGDEEQLLANIEGDVAAEGITLTHDGGDSFDSGDIAVVLTGDNDRDLALSDDFNASEGGSGQLAPGDVWRYNSSDDLILGSGRLLVVDESTNTVLLDEAYRVEVVPGGIELRVESFNHSDTQSDEADIFGKGDPNNDDGVRWDYEAFVDFDDDGDPVKNPDELNISFNSSIDMSAPLEHNLTDHDLVAYNPSSNPEPVTVTASVDGFNQSDDVNVDVFEVAELSITIDSNNINLIPPSPSPSPSSTQSIGALGFQSGNSPVTVVNGSSIEVPFTVSNNEKAPALNETILFTSPALESDKSREYRRINSSEDKTGIITLNLTDNLVGSQTIDVEIDGSEKATIALKIDDSLSQATDLVPNAKQQQTFRFTLDTGLLPGQTVTIEPDTPAGQDVYSNAELKVNDEGEGGGGTVKNNGNLVYEAPSSSNVAAGTSVEIRATKVDAGDLNSGPYEYEFTGPGFSDKSTQSSISRGSGDSGFDNVDATGFDSTGKQEQTLSFKLDSDDVQVGNQNQNERVAIDLTDAANSLNLQSAGVESVSNNVANTNDQLDSGSYVTVTLKSSYSSGEEVEVNLTGVKPIEESEVEVGFSRGANDTASATFEIGAQNTPPSPFESVEVTDIVPNGQGQQQLISFTANNSLSNSQLPEAGDTIDIRISAYEPVSGGEGQVAYGGSASTFDSQGQISNQNTNDNGQLTLEYKPDNDLSGGETIEIRATDINVARLDEQDDPYEVTVSPSNSLAAENTTFSVTRSGSADDAGSSTFTVEDLVGTGTQTQNITFEPEGEFSTGQNEPGAVTIDLTDAFIDGNVNWDDSISIVDGKGSLDSDNTSEAAYITYTADENGYNEEVTIQLTVNPDQDALDENYTIGVSRGTAGTAGTSFGVFEPATFDVTIQSNNDTLFGTQYGSTNGLSVTAEINNTGEKKDTQTITLDVDGTQKTTTETLAGGASKNVTLSLGNPSEGNYTATVASETDSAAIDARVFAGDPDFVAGLETVSGTDGDTVEVEFHTTNLDPSISTTDGVAAYQVALSFNENTNLLDYESVQSDAWSIAFDNSIGIDDGVSVIEFDQLNPATARPALTFNFTIDGTGTTSLVFDDNIEGVNGVNQITDVSGEEYDVRYVDGEVTTPSATTTADAVETVTGTTPDSESEFLEFDVDVDSGESATVTGVNVTKPAKQNSGVEGSFDKLDGANPEMELTPVPTGDGDQAGQYDGVYTVGTLQPLDTNAEFSDGSKLSVRLGKADSGNVQLTYDQVASETNSDITVTLQFADGSSHETYLEVTNVNS